MSKDLATLQNECAYFEQELTNFKIDHTVMRRFLGELLSPEGYGYAVTPEIRSKASEILRGLKA
jgi:hypothetical protein